MAKGRGDTVEDLFSPKRQYEIPIYQRRYVWGPENWNALWTDIQEKFNSRFNGEQSTSHFTGIIITRKAEKGQGLPKYQILDGQQRLTTFQILLCVIRDLSKSKEYTLRSDSADLLVKNEGYNEKYKLYPKEGFDEKAFQNLVNSGPRGDHVMHRAYDHFMSAITDQIGTDIENIDHLYNAITNDFHMVQIDLKKGDEPEKIFASLNATGRMLDEFDHLRNDLFLKAGEDGDKLYGTCWSHFDTDSYWEKPENLDQFLQHFLQATVNPDCFKNHEGKEIKAFDVYLKQYRPMLKSDQDINYEFCKLKRYSMVYREMNNPESRIGSRMKFYKEFEIDSLYPFILYIISEFSEFANSKHVIDLKYLLSDTDLDFIFDIIESYMMRRMLRWGSNDQYKIVEGINSFLPKIREERQLSFIRFLNHLASPSTGKHEDRWSTDREVELALTQEWRVTKGIRYILYRIELEKRRKEKNPERIEFSDEFYLEYIMPMRWENNWLLDGPDGSIRYSELFSDEYKRKNRSWFSRPSQQGLVDETYLKAFTLALDRKNRHRSIGNLTLIEKVIDNPEFLEKKPHFTESNFMINKAICTCENWDAPQIDVRTEKLIEDFHEIWKSANQFRKEYLSAKFPEGLIVQGIVSKITKKSIFLQLEDEFQGRIDVNEISWNKRVDPQNVGINLGDEIAASVLEISTQKIIPLSMKQLHPNPWNNVTEKYKAGSVVSGRIVSLTNFGVFVEIEKDIEGLIYNSELVELNIEKPEEIFTLGEQVNVKINWVSQKDQQISLSLETKCIDKPMVLVTCSGRNTLPKAGKSDILFSFPDTAEGILHDYIKIQRDVKKISSSQNKNRKGILKILDSLLSSGYEKNVHSLAVTRAGHELYGAIMYYNSDEIGMQIRGVPVTVYRHGLIEFSTMEYHQGRVIEFNRNKGEGLIRSGNLPRIIVSISDVCGEHSVLPVGQIVEFEICQTPYRLAARNVVIIKE